MKTLTKTSSAVILVLFVLSVLIPNFNSVNAGLEKTPDLAVLSITAPSSLAGEAPSSVSLGNSVLVQATIKNIGIADSTGYTAEVYVYSGTEDKKVYSQTYPKLAVNGSVIFKYGIDGSNFVEGKNTITIKVVDHTTLDYSTSVYPESILGNNHENVTVIVGDVESLPDLEVNKIYTVELPDSSRQVKANVTNNSKVTLAQDFKIEMTYSYTGADGLPIAGTNNLVEDYDFAPGEQKAYLIAPVSWVDGTYRFSAKVDADNVISESNEANNYLEETYEVRGRPAVIISNDDLSIEPTHTTVTWTTNVPATSFVSYVKRGQTSWSWQGNDSLVTDHMVVLTDLVPLTGYEYQIKSADAGGLMTTSESKYFTTADQIRQINTNAEKITENNFDSIITELKELRNKVKEQEARIKYLEKLLADASVLSAEAEEAINDFIVYGVDANTQSLGAGERAGVVNSFKSAFGKLPTVETDWQDVIKIANGRWPSQRSTQKEAQAKEAFRKVYTREADTSNPNDDAAVTVMAYGLRPSARNTESEVAAIQSFKHIYGYYPTSAFDWDIVRAIAYSGASR